MPVCIPFRTPLGPSVRRPSPSHGPLTLVSGLWECLKPAVSPRRRWWTRLTVNTTVFPPRRLVHPCPLLARTYFMVSPSMAAATVHYGQQEHRLPTRSLAQTT